MPADDPREPSDGRGRGGRAGGPRTRLARALSGPPVRGRRVKRTVRHVEPWSVARIALLFYATLFLIICVASALLWTGARASGTLENVESFITSIGGFGDCEPIEGFEPTNPTTTVAPDDDGEVRQLDPNRGSEDLPEDEALPDDEDEEDLIVPDEDEDCGEGRELVGEFRFEDIRVFQAFAFGGVVLVFAGTGATVVLVLLFNLMSDLTGGVQMTVVEEDQRRRRKPDAGSPPPPDGG